MNSNIITYYKDRAKEYEQFMTSRSDRTIYNTQGTFCKISSREKEFLKLHVVPATGRI
jgi:hypothetical protein